MNTLSFTEVDSVFEAQMRLSMEWADKFKTRLRHLTQNSYHSLNSLTKVGVDEFYPNISHTEDIDSMVLNACLEQTKEFLFGDGLPVREKIALLQYHFEASFNEHSKSILSAMLDNVAVCGQGNSEWGAIYSDEWPTLAEYKRRFVAQSLPKLVEARNQKEKNEKLIQDLTEGKRGVQQKLSRLSEEDEENSQTKSRLHQLIQQADAHLRQACAEDKQLKEDFAKLFEHLATPFKLFVYDKHDIKKGVGGIVSQIVAKAKDSELSALPQALSPNSVVIATGKQTASAREEEPSVKRGNNFVG